VAAVDRQLRGQNTQHVCVAVALKIGQKGVGGSSFSAKKVALTGKLIIKM
jgi:hypothetical protein